MLVPQLVSAASNSPVIAVKVFLKANRSTQTALFLFLHEFK